MTDLTSLSSADLAARYNELTGKSLKPSSYSKAKFIKMIKAATPAPKKRRSTDDGAIGAKDIFTLAQLARQLGINPKIARAKYRKVENDGMRTRYIFPSTVEEVARVTAILRPKKD